MEVWGGNRAVDNGVAMPGLNVFVHARPHHGHEAGGDVHYLSSCATGRITRLMVADVAGHGQSVSETALVLRGLMRRFINHLDQQKAVEQLNHEFSKQTHAGRFATAVLGTYWGPTGQLCLCNAGHPRPLWYRAKTRRWEPLEPPQVASDGEEADAPMDVPLGVLDSTTYRQLGVRLRAGDLVLLYTDSLTEARTVGGGLLGEQGLIDILNGLGEPDPSTLIASLNASLAASGCTIDDDLTALLLSPNGLTPRLTIRERFAAIGHILRGLLPSRERSALPEFGLNTVGGFFIDRLNRAGNGAGSKTGKSGR